MSSLLLGPRERLSMLGGKEILRSAGMRPSFVGWDLYQSRKRSFPLAPCCSKFALLSLSEGVEIHLPAGTWDDSECGADTKKSTSTVRDACRLDSFFYSSMPVQWTKEVVYFLYLYSKTSSPLLLQHDIVFSTLQQGIVYWLEYSKTSAVLSLSTLLPWLRCTRNTGQLRSTS